VAELGKKMGGHGEERERKFQEGIVTALKGEVGTLGKIKISLETPRKDSFV